MPLPTLMIKGKLASPTGDPLIQEELDNWVPYEYIIDWFVKRRWLTGVGNRVLILKSETASGKSTMLPPELYRALVMGGEVGAPGIICTQPRVLTAIENVNEMLKHYSKIFRLGETIGWSTQYNKLRPTSLSLLSATIGTLWAQLKTMTDEQIMKKYKYILIDETHERDLVTDVTIYMLKNLVLRCKDNPNCPFVVLMSATFEPRSFLEYFGITARDNFIWCKGATAPIDSRWDWNQGRVVNNYPQAAADVVAQISREGVSDVEGDVLIFLPGKAEMDDCAIWLNKLNKTLAESGGDTFSLLKVDSEAVNKNTLDFKKLIVIPIEEQVQVFDGKTYIPKRRVIMSTNVAETGLTLDNLKYVIDAGFNREIEFNPIYGVTGLLTKPAPRSRITQRRGRVGRKFAGVFYPLYPLYIYDMLPQLQFPAILVSDITPAVMDIINEQLKSKRLKGVRDPQFNIADIDMVDPPTPDALLYALEKMYQIGFISPMAPEWDGSITDHFADRLSERTSPVYNTVPRFGITDLGLLAMPLIGQLMSPETIRMVLAGYSWGASIGDLLTIAAYITLGPSMIGLKPPKEKRIVGNSYAVAWGRIYRDGVNKDVAGSLFKIRMLIGCEFIDAIFLFQTVKLIMSDDGLTSLKKWCTTSYINIEFIIKFIELRDLLIEQFIMSEYSIANDQSAISLVPQKEFMNAVTKLKHCIYDGYRCNIIKKGSDGRYIGYRGVVVSPPKLFASDEYLQDQNLTALSLLPNYIVTTSLGIKQNKKTGVMTCEASTMSIMDSYVSIDPEFAL